MAIDFTVLIFLLGLRLFVTLLSSIKNVGHPCDFVSDTQLDSIGIGWSSRWISHLTISRYHSYYPLCQTPAGHEESLGISPG